MDTYPEATTRELLRDVTNDDMLTSRYLNIVILNYFTRAYIKAIL